VAPYFDPPPPPSPPRGGTNPFILLLALMGLGAFLLLGGVAAFLIIRGFDRAREVAAGGESASATSPPAKLPSMERHVPHHAVSLLEGCSEDEVRTVATGIDSAIDVGAPLYNAGNFAGCFHMYEGTAADLERKLGPTCVGPARALAAGRTRAASLATPSAQAWAMRDAFDGLMDVISRSPKRP
jgi:serine protease Do